MSIVLILFWVTSILFAGDVVLGKLDVITGGAVHPLFGEIPHFLLLALASALLMAESLRREASRKKKNSETATLKNSQNKTN
jgi:hypothetical protein